MGKIVGLFSGQGSQYSGMGKELYDNFAKAREIYECAGDILGKNIANISFTATEEELAQTLVAQPAIFALSVAAYTVALDEMEAPSAVAGHSLGEFAALYAAGAYSLEDGFRIIDARAKAMDAAGEKAKGAMAAVMKKDVETVTKACEATGGFVLPVNLNLPDQTVISGDEDAVKQASEALQAEGAKVVKLGVSSAFHTAMMAPAAEEFSKAVEGIVFQPTKIPFFSNLTGGELIVENYPEYFAKHMVSPVRFVEQVAAMTAWGAEKMIEFGPKKTVSNLARKNNKNLTVGNIEDLKTLEKAKSL